MSRWIEAMSPTDRDDLIDAGRIGSGRFDGPPPVNVPGTRIRRQHGHRMVTQPGAGASHSLSDELDAALNVERANTMRFVRENMPPAILATDGGPAVAYAMRLTAWLDEQA